VTRRHDTSAALRLGWAAAAAFALVVSACDRGDSPWRRELLQARAAKEAFFRGPDSPLAPSARSRFRHLRYFAPAPEWNLRAELDSTAAGDTVALLTSAGDADRYIRLGRLQFAHAGRRLQLLLYRSLGDGTYFLPFSDATSGRQTYGAGRYLEPWQRPDGGWQLDFNRAYNPYCAYDKRWVCPLAPAENHLGVRVTAGEKTFDEH
jgi:uncharacterized protein (DUF1684 family)